METMKYIGLDYDYDIFGFVFDSNLIEKWSVFTVSSWRLVTSQLRGGERVLLNSSKQEFGIKSLDERENRQSSVAFD